jgi:hypothetical protein
MRNWLCATLILLGACSTPPAMVRSLEELRLIQEIEAAAGRAIEAEKSSVLTQTDEESDALAAEATAASNEVDRDLAKLRELILVDQVPRRVQKFEAVEKAWGELREIDASLLALAVTDTNLKATRIASGEALRTVGRLVDELTALAKDRDPEQQRALFLASIAALEIQTVLPLHIASATDSEMTELETGLRAEGGVVDRAVAALQGDPRGSADAVRAAAGDWASYGRMVAEVVRLSRENSDVLSSQISIGVKRQVTARFRNALAALAAEIRSSDQPGAK